MPQQRGGNVSVSKKLSITPEHGKLLAVLLFVGLALLSSLAGWASADSSDQPMEPLKLVDRWVRPDGGYILELREFASDPYTVDTPLAHPTPFDDWIPKDARFNDGAPTIVIDDDGLHPIHVYD